MSKRIGVTIATLLAGGAVGLAGPANAAAPGSAAKPQCAYACPAIYQPVTCKLSNGRVMTFSNRCEAGRYACQRGLKIRSCVEGV